MKMSMEHYAIVEEMVKAVIETVGKAALDEHYRKVVADPAVRIPKRRMMWDIWHSTGDKRLRFYDCCDGLYSDSHIETAIRKVVNAHYKFPK